MTSHHTPRNKLYGWSHPSSSNSSSYRPLLPMSRCREGLSHATSCAPVWTLFNRTRIMQLHTRILATYTRRTSNAVRFGKRRCSIFFARKWTVAAAAIIPSRDLLCAWPSDKRASTDRYTRILILRPRSNRRSLTTKWQEFDRMLSCIGGSSGHVRGVDDDWLGDRE